MQRLALIDGTKAALVDNLPAEAWIVHSGDREDGGIDALYSNVAFLYRCVEMRANAIASLPWYIMRGDVELWSHNTDDVPSELLFAEHLPDLLWQIESAWCLRAEAFMLKQMNRVRVRELKWLAPWSITPQWDENDGLIGFERRLSRSTGMFSIDKVVYLRLPGQHETKPRTPPAQAAMAAAGVVYSVDLFAKMFFERGAIKATLLTVSGNPLPEERERLKNWWKRAATSISKAFSTEVISADSVKPIVVGEGIESLSSGTLMKERREDIATAMGVPHSMIISSASNFATAKIDRLNFHNTTIIPESVILQRQLNRQLFEPLGLRFQFRPYELDVYQEDENERAEAFKKYVDAGIKRSIAVQMLGIDLPQGVEPEDLDDPEPPTQPEAQPEAQSATQPQPRGVQSPPIADLVSAVADEPSADDNAKSVEVAVFKRWWKKRKSADTSQFNSTILTDAEKVALVEEMAEHGVEDVTGSDAFFRQSYP
jgi:HK97 family phage portal protein